MGLTDTNILKKIAGVLGFPLTKKQKKEQGGGSPKKESKGAKSGKSAAKSNTKTQKQTSAMLDMAISIQSKQFCVSDPISQPIFRYIPDRETIQRLLLRCSNMQDDLGDFDMNMDNESQPEVVAE